MHKKVLVALAATFALACSGSEPTGPDKGGETKPPVATVEVINAPTEMETGKSKVISVTLKDASGNLLAGRDITWESNNDAVLVVTATGTLHSHTPGTAVITAKSEGKAGSVTVKVDTRTGFIKAIVESVRAQYDLVGLAGGIVTRQSGMFGHASSGKRRATQAALVTDSDLWHIGSNLKAITAHVAGIAVAEGKISWTTTLAEAYPEYSATMRTQYRNVTLRMLLGHIGGLQANINTADVPAGSLTAQRASIARITTQVAPTGGGVGTYTYSNVGYVIAANMVERAMGMTWEEIMQQKLLTPLSITAFGWGPTPAATNPIGHQRSGTTWQEWPTSDNAPFLSAAGRSHWSMEGWGKVLQDILKADQGQSALVPQAVARINTTSQSSANYASGWQTSTAAWAQGRGVEHDGSNNLNYARMQLALDRGVGVLAVTNSHDPNSNRSVNAMATLTERLWSYYAANSN